MSSMMGKCTKRKPNITIARRNICYHNFASTMINTIEYKWSKKKYINPYESVEDFYKEEFNSEMTF